MDINGDGRIAYLDPTIYLFRADGSLDRSDYTFQTSEFSFNIFRDGSVSFLDPYLELANVLTPGNYLVAIGSDDLTLDAAIAGSYAQSIGPIGPGDTVAASGAYQVTITTVPEPGSAVLLGAGLYAREYAKRDCVGSAGVLTALLAPRWSYVEPSIAFSPFLTFEVVIMALLGGVHRLWGPLLGVIPFTLLWEFISAKFPAQTTLLLGVSFLLIVYVIPRGVVGLLEDLIGHRRGGSGSAGAGGTPGWLKAMLQWRKRGHA